MLLMPRSASWASRREDARSTPLDASDGHIVPSQMILIEISGGENEEVVELGAVGFGCTADCDAVEGDGVPGQHVKRRTCSDQQVETAAEVHKN